MKRIASLLIALFLFCGAVATAEETVETRSDSTGTYEYVLLEDGSAEITGYFGDAEVLEIPAELDGHSVTSIGERAFFFCKNLTSVTIPDSVASIGNLSFSSCDNLTSVIIPDGVTSIGANPFLGCGQLQTIQVSPDHPILATIDGVLFEKTTKTLIFYPAALDAAEYAIPEGILSIGENAFSGCFGLTSVTIPDSVTSISDYAFLDCYGLTSITLSDSVTSIGESAFFFCYNLTSVTIPDSVTFIGVNAFSNCSDDLVLTVERDSYAKSYAEENGISYTYPDANDWLNS